MGPLSSHYAHGALIFARCRYLEWVDAKGGMGNQLGGLSGALLLAACTGRRISVASRTPASVASWLWSPGSGFFEEPFKHFRAQKTRRARRRLEEELPHPPTDRPRSGGQLGPRRVRADRGNATVERGGGGEQGKDLRGLLAKGKNDSPSSHSFKDFLAAAARFAAGQRASGAGGSAGSGAQTVSVTVHHTDVPNALR